MSRTFGSTVTHRSVLSRLLGPVIIAAVASSLAAVGCGSSGGGETTCDLAGVGTLFAAKGCTGSACHDAAGFAAGLNLVGDSGLAGRLVGKGPVANMGQIPSSCAGMGKMYLDANSSPATGFLIDKVTSTYQGCGGRMPLGFPALSDSDVACIRSWATTVTKP